MVRALALAGVRCDLASPAGDPGRWSRTVGAWFDTDRDDVLDELIAHARAQDDRPALFVQDDWALLAIERRRGEVEEAFRAPLAPAGLAEDVIDKGRFQRLAERLGLPVPRGRVLRAGEGDTDGLGLPFLVKPLARDAAWDARSDKAKALLVPNRVAWASMRERFARDGQDVLAQELIPGPESRIESYHAYVAPDGQVLGEFTGRKLRTRPTAFGVSTALVTTDDDELVAFGRDAIARLGLTGPAKLDVKRDDRGAIRLLEVNARFTLWAHLGAKAGVNLAGLAYADLHGARRLPALPARAGVRWCHPLQDLRSAREQGEPLARWARFALASEARHAVALDDPMPLLRGQVWRRITAR
jgi:predicted ATP-grasp superfamily ATP-dependent carboligase